jgi:hypothetical protein
LNNWGQALEMIGKHAVVADASIFWNDSKTKGDRTKITQAFIGIVCLQSLKFVSLEIDTDELYQNWMSCNLGMYGNCANIVKTLELSGILKSVEAFPNVTTYNDSQDAVATAKMLLPSASIEWLPRLSCRLAHEVAAKKRAGTGQIHFNSLTPTRGWIRFEFF